MHDFVGANMLIQHPKARWAKGVLWKSEVFVGRDERHAQALKCVATEGVVNTPSEFSGSRYECHTRVAQNP